MRQREPTTTTVATQKGCAHYVYISILFFFCILFTFRHIFIFIFGVYFTGWIAECNGQIFMNKIAFIYLIFCEVFFLFYGSSIATCIRTYTFFSSSTGQWDGLWPSFVVYICNDWRCGQLTYVHSTMCMSWHDNTMVNTALNR